ATLHVYDALARVHGVGQVVVFGARDYGMRIWLDPAKMARLAVTTQDVSTILNEQNVVAPAGTVGAEPAPPGQQMQYVASVKGRLSTPEQYGNIVVRTAADDAIVYLKDIARIELAATDYSRSSRLNGVPTAIIGVYQLPDANALEVAKGVRKVMDSLAPTFPKGIHYVIPYDTTLFVSESVREVVKTLLAAGVLVLLVVFIFLESWRATLIPMLAIPVSLIGTFSAFLALGFSLNTLTLFALVLAIGLVVDDAIVVVEAATEIMDSRKLSAREAAKAAMKEVSGPVVAIALVLSAVFVPVAFLGGLTGQFYRQFALTLSASVLISAFVALTFTPALCTLLLQPRQQAEAPGPLGRFFGWFNRAFASATREYKDTVRRTIRRSAVALAVFGAVVIAVAVLVERRPSGFLPEDDQGYLLMVAQLPPGASFQRTEAVLEEMRQIVMRQANIIVVAPPAIPGIGQAGGFEFIVADTSGGSLDQFNAALQAFISAANRRPELTRVATQFNNRVPQIEYVIDRERAKSLGIPI